MSFVITVRFLLIAVGVFGSTRCSHEEALSFDTLVATHSAVVLGSGEVPSRDVHFCALLLHHWPKIPRYQWRWDGALWARQEDFDFPTCFGLCLRHSRGMFQQAQRTGVGELRGGYPGIWCPNHLLQPVVSGWPWISKPAGSWWSSHLCSSLDWLVCCYPNAEFYESVPSHGQSTIHAGPGTTVSADDSLCCILLDMLFRLSGSRPMDGLDVECPGVSFLHPCGCGWGVLCFWSPFGNINACSEGLQHHNQGTYVHTLRWCMVDGKWGLCKLLCMPTLLHSDGHQFKGYYGLLAIPIFDVWCSEDGDRDRDRDRAKEFVEVRICTFHLIWGFGHFITLLHNSCQSNLKLQVVIGLQLRKNINCLSMDPFARSSKRGLERFLVLWWQNLCLVQHRDSNSGNNSKKKMKKNKTKKAKKGMEEIE